jgi:sugar lactone lactonase YvrE
MNRVFLTIAIVIVGARPAAAAFSPADSAAVARSAWREALQARAKGDHVAAMLKADRAHAAWPTQWYYAYGLARLAAEAGEPSTTARALDDVAAIGAAPLLTADSTLMAMGRENISVQTSIQRVAANAVPLAHSRTLLTFAAADSEFYPEGLAHDARTGRWFVASVHERKIAVAAPDKPARDFVPAGAGGMRATLALAVDSRRGRLWATSAGLPQMAGYAAEDSGQASIHAFDLASGKVLARHDLPRRPEGHVPGDACVAPNGDLYVSDSSHPAIWRVRAGAKDGTPPEEWLSDPAFRSLQGQAFSADGKTLFLADYSHGLAAIDVATKAVRWLEPPPGACVLGIDGMGRDGDDLVCVQNGIAPPRIVRVKLAAGPRITGLEVLDRNTAIADEPTMGVVSADAFVYVANSLWEKYGDEGVRRYEVPLTAPTLLSVPLGRTK